MNIASCYRIEEKADNWHTLYLAFDVCTHISGSGRLLLMNSYRSVYNGISSRQWDVICIIVEAVRRARCHINSLLEFPIQVSHLTT